MRDKPNLKNLEKIISILYIKQILNAPVICMLAADIITPYEIKDFL